MILQEIISRFFVNVGELGGGLVIWLVLGLVVGLFVWLGVRLGVRQALTLVVMLIDVLVGVLVGRLVVGCSFIRLGGGVLVACVLVCLLVVWLVFRPVGWLLGWLVLKLDVLDDVRLVAQLLVSLFFVGLLGYLFVRLVVWQVGRLFGG